MSKKAIECSLGAS